MDEITWKRSIARRQRRIQRQRRFFVLALIAAIGIAMSVWYVFFYMRTPEYALKEVHQAYDDLTRDLFAYDATLTPKTRVLFEKFYILVKPELTRGTQEAILRRVESGLWTLPDGLDILKGHQLGIDFERFLARTQLRNTTLVSVGSITHEGTTATADVNVREDDTDTSFTLVVVLEEAEDGHWQVAYIKNYRNYLDTISPLVNDDIASYIDATKPIVDEFNASPR